MEMGIKETPKANTSSKKSRRKKSKAPKAKVSTPKTLTPAPSEEDTDEDEFVPIMRTVSQSNPDQAPDSAVISEDEVEFQEPIRPRIGVPDFKLSLNAVYFDRYSLARVKWPAKLKEINTFTDAMEEAIQFEATHNAEMAISQLSGETSDAAWLHAANNTSRKVSVYGSNVDAALMSISNVLGAINDPYAKEELQVIRDRLRSLGKQLRGLKTNIVDNLSFLSLEQPSGESNRTNHFNKDSTSSKYSAAGYLIDTKAIHWKAKELEFFPESHESHDPIAWFEAADLVFAQCVLSAKLRGGDTQLTDEIKIEFLDNMLQKSLIGHNPQAILNERTQDQKNDLELYKAFVFSRFSSPRHVLEKLYEFQNWTWMNGEYMSSIITKKKVQQGRLTQFLDELSPILPEENRLQIREATRATSMLTRAKKLIIEKPEVPIGAGDPRLTVLSSASSKRQAELKIILKNKFKNTLSNIVIAEMAAEQAAESDLVELAKIADDTMQAVGLNNVRNASRKPQGDRFYAEVGGYRQAPNMLMAMEHGNIDGHDETCYAMEHSPSSHQGRLRPRTSDKPFQAKPKMATSKGKAVRNKRLRR
jgi:hypothetical protein